MAEFKDRLKELMELRGKRAIDLSNETRISKGTISKYLSGYVKAKSDCVLALAKALNVNPIYLMGMSDDITPPDYKKLSDKVKREDELIKAIESQLYDLDLNQLEQVSAIIKTFSTRK